MLRLIVTLLGRALERESIFPVGMTHHCLSLASMGAGTVMGLEVHRVFTRPTAVWKHLERLRACGEARWARKQQLRTAKHPAKMKGTAGKAAHKQPPAAANAERKRSPANGGAKSVLKHYSSDFYAKTEKALAKRRDALFALSGGAAIGRGSGRLTAPIFAPPAAREGANKKETRRRLTKSWVCEQHGNPPCPTFALARRGVRQCCNRRHHTHPKDACTPRQTSRRARLASKCDPGVGACPPSSGPWGGFPLGPRTHATGQPNQ